VSITASEDFEPAISLQGHYAGAVTRLVAFVVDQTTATALFAAGTAIAAWCLSLVLPPDFSFDRRTGVAAVLFVGWLFIYYAYAWSVSGKTLGMALMGIQVVQRDGSAVTPKHGVKRTVAFPVTFLTLGIGFLPIMFGRERRAMHDGFADTAVVYAWDARAARLRFLARQNNAGPRPVDTGVSR
jgi:uncharacterized RDD family membrane protein YckC